MVETFESGWNSYVWPFKWKLLSRPFLWYRALSGGTKLFRTSNFTGPCFHEALLFSGLASLFLLFVYCFLSQFCEAFRELRGTSDSTFPFWGWNPKTVQIKASVQYFPVLLTVSTFSAARSFILLFKFYFIFWTFTRGHAAVFWLVAQRSPRDKPKKKKNGCLRDYTLTYLTICLLGGFRKITIGYSCA